jgi:hypothetical protein
MSFRCTVLVALSLLFATASSARTYPNEGARVQVDIPDNWKVESSNNELEAQSADGSIGLFFTVFPVAEIDKAMADIEKEIESHVKNLKDNDDLKEIKHEGMTGASMTATGTIEGESVTIGVVMFETSAKKVVLMMAAAKTSDWDKKKRDAESIFKTLRPLKK